jgi:hypothetical protein
LLTVGRYTYTSDQRFEAMHSPHTEEWTLRIRYAQRKDSGKLTYFPISYLSLFIFHFKSSIKLQTSNTIISSKYHRSILICHFISGIYECQISTTPPIGHFVYLTVVGKFEINSNFTISYFSSLKNLQSCNVHIFKNYNVHIVIENMKNIHCQGVIMGKFV